MPKPALLDKPASRGTFAYIYESHPEAIGMQRKKRIAKRNAAIIHDYKAGLTCEKIAARHNVSESTVYGLRRKAGVPGRHRISCSRVPKDRARGIVEAYCSGEPIEKIAKTFDVSIATVHNVKNDAGVEPRKKKGLSPKEKVRVVKLYKSGGNVTALARQFDVGKTSVERALKEANVTRRGVKKWFCNEAFFESQNETTAYWMGFLMADGSLVKQSKTGWRLSLSLQRSDLSHLRQFCIDAGVAQKAISERELQDAFRKKPTPMVTVVLSHAQFADWLLPWGIVPRKTYDFVAPTIPKKLYPAYLRGWFDGDGNLSSKKGAVGLIAFRATLVAYKREALDWYASALEAIGYEGETTLTHKKTKTGEYHTLEVHRKADILQLADSLRVSTGLCMKRKWKQLLDTPREYFLAGEIMGKELLRMKTLYQAKHSCREIAEELDLTEPTVRQRLTRAGILIPQPRTSEDTKAKMAALYEESERTQQSIAEEFGVSQWVVRDALDKHKVKPRPRGATLRLSPDIRKQIVRKYSTNMSMRAVARAVGVSAAAVRKAIVDANVTVRERKSKTH